MKRRRFLVYQDKIVIAGAPKIFAPCIDDADGSLCSVIYGVSVAQTPFLIMDNSKVLFCCSPLRDPSRHCENGRFVGVQHQQQGVDVATTPFHSNDAHTSAPWSMSRGSSADSTAATLRVQYYGSYSGHWNGASPVWFTPQYHAQQVSAYNLAMAMASQQQANYQVSQYNHQVVTSVSSKPTSRHVEPTTAHAAPLVARGYNDGSTNATMVSTAATHQQNSFSSQGNVSIMSNSFHQTITPNTHSVATWNPSAGQRKLSSQECISSRLPAAVTPYSTSVSTCTLEGSTVDGIDDVVDVSGHEKTSKSTPPRKMSTCTPQQVEQKNRLSRQQMEQKNRRNRDANAKNRQRIAAILSKPEENRTEEEKLELQVFENRRATKNRRGKERRQEKKAEVARILAKPKEQWTKVEKELIDKTEADTRKKNSRDRDRRKRFKEAKEQKEKVERIFAKPQEERTGEKQVHVTKELLALRRNHIQEQAALSWDETVHDTTSSCTCLRTATRRVIQ